MLSLIHISYSLTQEQEEAVRQAAENRICIITGGPGTGKTTILKAVLSLSLIHI